ncbi:MAG: hypothetical protein PWP23_57 [Candidatus Sumerlaeota bacterium]|nr:hypothetical protein [Candidatus Sumerlaeota bacterium]
MGIETSDSPAPVGRRLLIAVCLLLALGFGLRTIDIWLKPDIPGVVAAPDEGYSVMLATGTWTELFRQTAADTHPPFYYALLKVWFLAAPGTQASARFLSVLFSTGTLIYVFLLGRRLFGNAAALCALAFAALAPYQIYWGHLARMHAVLPLFVAMIIYHTLAWLEEGRRRDWLLCALGWVLAVQTNYMGLVFGAVWGVAVLAWSAAPWRQRLLLLPAGLVGLVTFLPWLRMVLDQVESGPMNRNFFQETVSPVYLYYHALFGVMHPYQPNQQGIAYVFFLLFAILFVAGIAPVGRRPGLWVLLLLAPTLPIVIAKSQGWTLAERHLLFTLPLFMAYWGACCVSFWGYLRQKLKKAP